MSPRALVSAAILAAVSFSPLPAAAEPVARSARSVTDSDYSTRRICRVTPVIGTRLGGARICKTRAEWDDYARDQRSNLERIQAFTPACAVGSNMPGQASVVCGN